MSKDYIDANNSKDVRPGDRHPLQNLADKVEELREQIVAKDAEIEWLKNALQEIQQEASESAGKAISAQGIDAVVIEAIAEKALADYQKDKKG